MFSSCLGRFPSPSDCLATGFFLWKTQILYNSPTVYGRFCSMNHGKYASLLICSCLFLQKFMWKKSHEIFYFFSTWYMCLLALWWELIDGDLPNISKGAQHLKEGQELELTCRAEIEPVSERKRGNLPLWIKQGTRELFPCFSQGPLHDLSLNSCETSIYLYCGFHFTYV